MHHNEKFPKVRVDNLNKAEQDNQQRVVKQTCQTCELLNVDSTKSSQANMNIPESLMFDDVLVGSKPFSSSRIKQTCKSFQRSIYMIDNSMCIHKRYVRSSYINMQIVVHETITYEEQDMIFFIDN